MGDFNSLRKILQGSEIKSMEELAPKVAEDTGESLGGKAARWISAPQRFALNKGAQMIGAQGNPNNSEQSSQAIVENLANRVGIPENSTIGNAAKAAAVGGLEVFGDPLQFLPVGKIAKIGEHFPQVAKMAEHILPAAEKVAPEAEKIIPQVARGADDLADLNKTVPITRNLPPEPINASEHMFVQNPEMDSRLEAARQKAAEMADQKGYWHRDAKDAQLKFNRLRELYEKYKKIN